MIPYELRNWIDKGWRFGSSQERYEQEPKPSPGKLTPLKSPQFADEDEAELWQSLPPKKRPPEFNLLLKSLVRGMAETFEDEEAAYAIDKTQWVFEDHQLEQDRKLLNDRNPAMEQFRKLQHEFSQMPQEKRFAWRDRALRKYPRIEQFVEGC